MISRLVIRADASLTIGTGHIMRCLTLAQALRKLGWQIRFVARDLEGNQNSRVVASGFDLSILPPPQDKKPTEPGRAHAHWSEVPWLQDSAETRAIVEAADADWLVVDHYAFDDRWEQASCPEKTKLMVIDDLADRSHVCDLLLDQNLGRKPEDYDGMVPDACERLIGPSYALLRPEFAELRDYSLRRRKSGILEHIIVSMGGVDLPNATTIVLNALRDVPLPPEVHVTVVMGGNAPALTEVASLAADMPFVCEIKVDVADMASLFASADMAIGGAGATAWERCVLGVPSLLVVIADNQNEAAEALEKSGAAINLGKVGEHGLPVCLRVALTRMATPSSLLAYSAQAAAILDGNCIWLKKVFSERKFGNSYSLQ